MLMNISADLNSTTIHKMPTSGTTGYREYTYALLLTSDAIYIGGETHLAVTGCFSAPSVNPDAFIAKFLYDGTFVTATSLGNDIFAMLTVRYNAR